MYQRWQWGDSYTLCHLHSPIQVAEKIILLLFYFLKVFNRECSSSFPPFLSLRLLLTGKSLYLPKPEFQIWSVAKSLKHTFFISSSKHDNGHCLHLKAFAEIHRAVKSSEKLKFPTSANFANTAIPILGKPPSFTIQHQRNE